MPIQYIVRPIRDGMVKIRKLAESDLDEILFIEKTVQIHKTPFYKQEAILPVTNWAASSVVSLPVHPKVSQKDLKFISKIIHEIL